MQYILEDDLEKIRVGLNDCIGRFAGKKIVLTGGAGFLGYCFIHFFIFINDAVLKEPCKVICVDNFVRGEPLWLEDLEKKQKLEIIKTDITKLDMSSLGSVDFIIHAASIASPTYYRSHPIETMDANVNGLRNLLEYCRERQQMDNGIESFLFFSTSEIYGDPSPEAIPTPETYRGFVSCTGPRACYDESKRFGETLCVNFYKAYSVPVKIVRPFNNYGPGLAINDRRVIPDFCQNVLKGENIVLLSDGSPKRTFCYITDAITGYILALLSNYNGDAFNIGSESPEISIKELAELIIEVGEEVLGVRELNVARKISNDKDYLVDNPNRRCPCIKKARELLGYSPRVNLREGLRKSLLWYKDQSLF